MTPSLIVERSSESADYGSGAGRGKGPRQLERLDFEEVLFEADAVFEDPLFALLEPALVDDEGLADDLGAELVLFLADDFELGFLDVLAFPLPDE